MLLLLRFRSQAELARQTGGEGPDGLQHFLHDSPWDEEAVRAALQRRVAWEARGGGALRLIIDDTVVERRGPEIEGLGIHHGGGGLVKGLCAVTACVLVGGLRLAFAALGYRPQGNCPRGEFRSKVELAEEVLKQARVLGRSVTVLLDSWYACKRVLNRIQLCGWRYVAALKANRIVIINGRKTRARHLAKGPRAYVSVRLSRRRRVRAAKVVAHLPGVGTVALFVTKVDGGVKYLVSNDLSLIPAAAVREYAARWEIETFHRDVKQHLGFGELWMRSWRAVQRHWTLCLLAHNTLQLWNAGLPARRRQRTCGEMARALRRAVPLPLLQRRLRFIAEAA
jgi:SRSO17 transposase